MVGKINEIIDNYEKRLQEMPFIPRGSFRRRMLRQDGGPNRDFLTYLFCDSGLAMQFLKDVGLYNRGEDYEYHLAQYMFLARC